MTKLIVRRALGREAVAKALSKEISSLPWVSGSDADDTIVPSVICVLVSGEYAGYLLRINVEDIGTGEDRFELVRISSNIAGVCIDRAFYTEEDVRKVLHESILPKLIRVYYNDLAHSLCQLFENNVEERINKDLIWSVTHLRCREDEVGMILTIDKDSIEIWYKEAEEGELPKMEIHFANEGHAFSADVLPDQIKWIEDLMDSIITKYQD